MSNYAIAPKNRRTAIAFILASAVTLFPAVSSFAQLRPENNFPGESRNADLAAAVDLASFGNAIERARSLSPIHTLLVAQNGRTIVDESFRGHSTSAPANIKSASKSIISALVGIAIDKGVLEGPEQKIAPLLRDKLPANPDPRIEDITIGHLLSMQAGLGRTSGSNYGRWVATSDWVEAALAQPFEAEPGGRMLYSTGNTHLLSAILTREADSSTLALARDWLGGSADMEIASWERDPQGIYLGGNQMAMSPRSLLAFGEIYRNAGLVNGERVLSKEWIEGSWEARAQSQHDGEGYGYGWFIKTIAGYEAYYAWGYGGQMLYVLPDLDLTVVITSEVDAPSARSGYKDELHQLVAETIIPTAAARRRT